MLALLSVLDGREGASNKPKDINTEAPLNVEFGDAFIVLIYNSRISEVTATDLMLYPQRKQTKPQTECRRIGKNAGD